MIEIHIQNRNGDRFTVLADDEDRDLIAQYKWRITGTTYKGKKWLYACCGKTIDGKPKKIYMHRLIAGAQDGQSVDHINSNRLDNRRENLRLCSHAENMRNRNKHRCGRKYKGVKPDGNKFTSKITARGQTLWLGTFATDIEAARAYDEAAIRLHGEFAKTNFGASIHE